MVWVPRYTWVLHPYPAVPFEATAWRGCVNMEPIEFQIVLAVERSRASAGHTRTQSASTTNRPCDLEEDTELHCASGSSSVNGSIIDPASQVDSESNWLLNVGGLASAWHRVSMQYTGAAIVIITVVINWKTLNEVLLFAKRASEL